MHSQFSSGISLFHSHHPQYPAHDFSAFCFSKPCHHHVVTFAFLNRVPISPRYAPPFHPKKLPHDERNPGARLRNPSKEPLPTDIFQNPPDSEISSLHHSKCRISVYRCGVFYCLWRRLRQSIHPRIRPQHTRYRFPRRLDGINPWHALKDSRFLHQRGIEFRRGWIQLVSTLFLNRGSRMAGWLGGGEHTSGDDCPDIARNATFGRCGRGCSPKMVINIRKEVGF